MSATPAAIELDFGYDLTEANQAVLIAKVTPDDKLLTYEITEWKADDNSDSD